MSDIPKYLPLSQRPRRDESAVTANWAGHVAALLQPLADSVEQATDEQWPEIADAANQALWLSTRSRIAGFSPRARPTLPRAEAAAGLREAARAAAAPGAKRGIRHLAAAVVGTWDIGRTTGRAVHVDPVASGAVALARSLAAPTPIRAVVTVRTLEAVDADWRVGTGPTLASTASEIVLFLYGRGGLPAESRPDEPLAGG